jgi:predicted metal-dependent peptidase
MSVISLKKCHQKIVDTVEMMLIDIKYKMPFYGELNLMVNFRDYTGNIETTAVNVTRRGMNFYYNSEFIDSIGTIDGTIPGSSKEEKKIYEHEKQKQINFLVLHNDFHLLFSHPQRAVSGRFDHKLASIAQDMIINHIIWEEIDHGFVSIPKYPDTEKYRESGLANKNMTLFPPKEYIKSGGELIFEELYQWLKEEKNEIEKNNSPVPQANTTDAYGNYGDNGEDTFSLSYILGNLENNDVHYLDTYMEDDIPQELRDTMAREIIDRLKARGLGSSNIEQVLNRLRKKKKDYLREIKRTMSNEIMGTRKTKSITRPNRRQIKGLKGNRKVKNKINVLLDTSGSMGGMFEKVLEYVFQNDIEINMCQVDTEVHGMVSIKTMKEMQEMNITGLGGTMLQPGIDLIADSPDYNKYNTVILTDGWCDVLDMSYINGKVLGVTCGDPIPIRYKPKKGYKEIVVEKPQ